MGALAKILKPFRRKSVDVDATNNRQSRINYIHASPKSANAVALPMTRQQVRNMARYEVTNNSYARGIVLTLANDCIGTGPRLQLLSDDSEWNHNAEMDFVEWAKACRLAEKLRAARMSKATDGEAFGVLHTNPRILHPVKLDVRLVESDQVANPSALQTSPNDIDGVFLDAYGNPEKYRILRYHPGDMYRSGLGTEYDDFPAASVLHYYRMDRPGQVRTLPELTPALLLFGQLREYTKAVVQTARNAAAITGTLETDDPNEEGLETGSDDDGDLIKPEAMDSFVLPSGEIMTLPDGYKFNAFRAEQPTSTYADFKRELVNEIARCLNMPFNVAAGNSSGYNYASGRLDHQVYYKAIAIEQSEIACQILDRLFSVWLQEYMLVMGGPRAGGVIRHQWFWDGFGHVDPVKEANAEAIRLANKTTTLAHECGRQGKDWEEVLKQRAREKQMMRDLGLDEAEGGAIEEDETDE